jgi:hypothetical protein
MVFQIAAIMIKANVLKDLQLGIKHKLFLFEEYLGLFVKEAGFRKK